MKHYNFRDALGLLLVGAFIVATGWLLHRGIPEQNKELVSYMLGQLSGFVAGVVAYHYITKAGEKELDQAREANTGKALDLAYAATPPAAPAADPASPTGAPGDPLHVVEELKP
jgi:hypothetical protein